MWECYCGVHLVTVVFTYSQSVGKYHRTREKPTRHDEILMENYYSMIFACEGTITQKKKKPEKNPETRN